MMPDLAEAVRLLQAGELVAFPTETVYGLGADAANPAAVAKIFAAKGRPADHPLIVHLPGAAHLERWARDIPQMAWELAEAFWPGPLTLILKRAAAVPDAVTGGQETVGVRVPAHPLALDLLRAYAQAGGGKDGMCGVAAPASVPEFLVKVIGEKYRLDLVAAPYRGSAPMMTDMLGNQIAAGVGSIPDFIENHKAGRIRVVAVLGGARQPALPDVPTFAELGLAGFEDVPYYGVFAPAGTPRDATERFGAALAKVIAIPAVHDRLTAMGLTVGAMSAAQLASREQAYAKTWARIIKASGFQPQ